LGTGAIFGSTGGFLRARTAHDFGVYKTFDTIRRENSTFLLFLGHNALFQFSQNWNLTGNFSLLGHRRIFQQF
jgi:hypothetical protein